MDGKDAGQQIHKLLAKETFINQNKDIQVPRWTTDSTLTVNQLTKQSMEENKSILKEYQF